MCAGYSSGGAVCCAQQGDPGGELGTDSSADDSEPEPCGLVCLAATGICRPGTRASAGGGWISKSGYLSKISIRTQPTSSFAVGFCELWNLGRGWAAYDGS